MISVSIVDLMLKDFDSDMTLDFMNYITLSCELEIENDAEAICDSTNETGLHLNGTKYEIITNNFNQSFSLIIFKDFDKVKKENMALFVALILNGQLKIKPSKIKLTISQSMKHVLSLLHSVMH